MDTVLPSKAFASADCDTICTIYLSLCTQSADANAFQGTGCSNILTLNHPTSDPREILTKPSLRGSLSHFTNCKLAIFLTSFEKITNIICFLHISYLPLGNY